MEGQAIRQVRATRCALYFLIAWPLLLLLLIWALALLYGVITNDGKALVLIGMMVGSFPAVYLALLVPALILAFIYFYLSGRLKSAPGEFAAAAFYTSLTPALLAGVLIVAIGGPISAGIGLAALVAVPTIVCALLIEKPWASR